MSLKKGWKNCTHHYLYPPPSGPTAFGKCKICGKVDESKNSIETNGWNGNRNLKLKKQGDKQWTDQLGKNTKEIGH